MMGRFVRLRLSDPRFLTALRISAIYLLISYVYLYTSDWFVSVLVPEPWLFAVNVSKGFTYVAVTGVGLLYFIYRALNEAQSAETRFKLLFDVIPDGVMIQTADGIIEFVNPTVLEMFGWTQSELVGNTRGMFIDETAPDIVEATRRRVRDGGIRQRFMLRKKDGTEIPVRVSSRDFLLQNGEKRVCLILHDLTEVEKYENKYLEGERLRLVGHLAGGVAHDFNNLLTVISGNTEVLLDLAKPDSREKRAADIIWMAGQQAAQLIRHLLAFARRQSLDPEVFSIRSRITDLMPLLTKAVGSHTEIEFRCEAETWLVYVDAAQLENAVLNLVLNAKDALRSDPRIIIEATNVTVGENSEFEGTLVPGNYVALSVTDFGVGMAPEVLSRAVEPFFTTKEVGHGIGLGLSTVFGFAKQSGGHLDIHSEQGAGTTITIYLPRPVNKETTAIDRTEPDEFKGGNERILVVEDDQLVRVFLENALSQLGYRVVSVNNSEEALAVFGDHGDIDVLVADVMLPNGLNGRELAAKLEQMHPQLAVLFISGFPDEIAIAEDSGQSSTLKKPFQVLDLAQRIRQVLEESKAKNETP